MADTLLSFFALEIINFLPRRIGKWHLRRRLKNRLQQTIPRKLWQRSGRELTPKEKLDHDNKA
jgi:hypothetical protein